MRPARAKITVYRDGTATFASKSAIQPDSHCYGGDRQPVGGKRAAIQAFSRASQNRFAKQWRLIDWDNYLEQASNSPSGRSFFLCLNMPQGREYTRKDFAAARNRLSKYLTDQYGDNYSGALWKSELSKTGLLHLHAVVYFVERQQTTDVTAAIKSIWHKAVKAGDPAELSRAVHVEACYHGRIRPLAGDLLHYLIKQPVAADGVDWVYGKCWGVFMADRLPTYEPDVIDCLGEEAEAAKVLLIGAFQNNEEAAQRPKVQKLSDQWRGFTLSFPPEVTTEVITDFVGNYQNLYAAFAPN